MSDRDKFEQWIQPWLWSIGGHLQRFGDFGDSRYVHAGVQIAWQAWQESRRDGFVSVGPLDVELP